jgi:hypothetical protein
MESLVTWFENTWLSSFVASNWWGWPLAETLHFIGLCLLIGVIGTLDLRMLGMARGLSIASMHRLVPWGVLGFALNVISGIAFIAADPGRFVPSALFQFKLLLILLAGINVLVFYVSFYRTSLEWAPDGDIPIGSKIIAATSLILWSAITLIGRFMAFV